MRLATPAPWTSYRQFKVGWFVLHQNIADTVTL
jgi:hypothetical protein